MGPFGILSSSEKYELVTQLAFLYMEKSDTSGLTPAEFAKKYIEVRESISATVEESTPYL